MKDGNYSSGKKFLNVLVSVFVFLVHVMRPLSVAAVLMGVLGLLGVFDLHVSHLMLLIIGLVMAISFVVPINRISIQLYEQRRLNKMLSMTGKPSSVSFSLAKETEPKKHGVWIDIVVGVAVNVVTMILERLLF